MIPTGSRRSKIRPPRKLSALVDNRTKTPFDYDSSWDTIANAIVHIQNKNVLSLLYEQLYRITYTLVLQKYGSKLYDDVSAIIGDHLQKRRARVLSILESSLANLNEEFLKAMCDEWTEHLHLMKFISDVLMYLNRVYVKECKKLLIYDLGILMFETHFLRHNDMEVARNLVDILNNEIAKNRLEMLSTRLYVVKMVAMLEMISEDRHGASASDLYHDNFEKQLLLCLEMYYTTASDKAMAALLGTRYVHHVYHLIKDEEARLQSLAAAGSGAGTLLRTETVPKIVQLMNHILIKGKLEHVMVCPLEMQGLLFWLEPVFQRTIAKLCSIADPTLLYLQDYTTEMRMLYDLEGRIDPERKQLKVRLRDLVVTQGLQLPEGVLRHLEQRAALAAANGAKNPPLTYASTPFVLAWIDSILQYLKELGRLVQDAFSGDHNIEFTVFASVKQFLNVPASRTKKKADTPSLNAAELLSVYIDHYIKQFSKPASAKKMVTDDTVNIDKTEDFCAKVVSFLKLVEDKYAFEAHYAAHFAKRFLNAKDSFTSASSANSSSGRDIEEVVLAKLWEEVFMGTHYLERIVKMKKDVTLSAELTSEWKRHVMENSLNVADLEIKICNLAEWPKSMTKDQREFAKIDGEIGIIWPAQLRETMRTFEEFWLMGKRNDNKALFWYPKFGHMDLRITYPSRTYDINLATYGGVIMMLFAPQSTDDTEGEPVLAFDEKRTLTYEEICELTKIPEFDLKRQLRSIAVAQRLRLLVKLPMSKDINAGDKFKLNSKFKAPSTKVKVWTIKSDTPKPLESRTEQDADEIQETIDEGRNHLINAAIVRTMKSRQSIKHNELIEEIIKQLQSRFFPAIVHVKQRIENLIEKEYLRRDPELPNVYHYIA